MKKKPEPDSFFEKNLRKHFSDILYFVQMNEAQGYLYPLIDTKRCQIK
ncbi:Rpn family recombination-promoting nuclease/putative transposase [Rickettsiella grylli]